MPFTQELTCRWSTFTWTPTRLLQGHLHRNCYTGVATQEFSQIPGDQIVSETPAKSDCSCSSISLWRQGQPRVAKCGVLIVLGQPSAEIARVGWENMWCGEMRNFFARSNRLRRSCVPDAPNMWWNVNFFWAWATLCRDRAGRTSKHVAKCKIWWGPAQPLPWNEGQPSKAGAKLSFWKLLK